MENLYAMGALQNRSQLKFVLNLDASLKINRISLKSPVQPSLKLEIKLAMTLLDEFQQLTLIKYTWSWLNDFVKCKKG
jgi:hypothetical protein